jgi:hypothetical protein
MAKVLPRVLVLAVLMAAIVFGQQTVTSAGDGCEYYEPLNTCIDTELCCVIPGSCENRCQVFTDHCHCVLAG